MKTEVQVGGINPVASFHSLSTWTISTHCCCHVQVRQINLNSTQSMLSQTWLHVFCIQLHTPAWFLSLAGIDLLLAVYISMMAGIDMLHTVMAGSEVILATVLAYFGQTSCHDPITRFVTSKKKKKAHYAQHLTKWHKSVVHTTFVQWFKIYVTSYIPEIYCQLAKAWNSSHVSSQPLMGKWLLIPNSLGCSKKYLCTQ